MLKLADVTVVYPDKTKAIDGLSLTVKPGEHVALLGENGAGKTSLLLAMVGILDVAAGGIEADGIPLTKKTANTIRNRVGLVFQNPDDQLFMPYIHEDVAFGCRHNGMPEEAIASRVDDTLRRLRIMHLKDRSPLKLSGGEKRMAAIATVLAMQPAILLFDEPTAFLDPKAKRLLIQTLKELEHTKIIATHDMPFAAEVCDRVVVLKQGRVAADGDLSLLRDEALLRDCGL